VAISNIADRICAKSIVQCGIQQNSRWNTAQKANFIFVEARVVKKFLPLGRSHGKS
jgi:hypothetical protein